MKKANENFIHAFGYWAKLPLLAVFFLAFGAASLQAQALKSQSDANVAVKQAIDEITTVQQSGSAEASWSSSEAPDDTQFVIDLRYFRKFLSENAEASSTQEALDATVEYFQHFAKSGARLEYFNQAKIHLMEIISD